MRLAQPAVNDQMVEKRQADLGIAAELRSLFYDIDENKSNSLSLQELEKCLKDIRVATYFEVKGLDIKDAELFFQMLLSSSKHTEIDMDTFISGCLSMKGLATNMDLLTLQFHVRSLETQMRKQLRALAHHMKECLLEQQQQQQQQKNAVEMIDPLCEDVAVAMERVPARQETSSNTPSLLPLGNFVRRNRDDTEQESASPSDRGMSSSTWSSPSHRITDNRDA